MIVGFYLFRRLCFSCLFEAMVAFVWLWFEVFITIGCVRLLCHLVCFALVGGVLSV